MMPRKPTTDELLRLAQTYDDIVFAWAPDPQEQEFTHESLEEFVLDGDDP